MNQITALLAKVDRAPVRRLAYLIGAIGALVLSQHVAGAAASTLAYVATVLLGLAGVKASDGAKPTVGDVLDSATDDIEEIAGSLSPDAANLVGQVAGLARDAVLDDGQEDTELEAIISGGRKTFGPATS